MSNVLTARSGDKMDIPRPDIARKKRRRRMLLMAGSVAALAMVSLAVSQLKPALPSVDRSSVWIDTVSRGTLVYEVRGNGVLVPEDIRWVAASSLGRVERILLLPGVTVTAETVLLELTNPEVEQAAFEAESDLKGAEAALEKLKVSLQSEHLAQEAVVASLKYELAIANADAEADESLRKDGLLAALTAKRSRAKADELANRYSLEQQRLEMGGQAARAQIAVQQAEANRYHKQYLMRQRQVDGLKVRAGMNGVLQRLGDEVPLQVGQQVAAGANLARIANPSRLKAQIRIPEMQAKDLQIDQPAVIDTRNGTAAGRVSRIDPGVQDGTVTVDIACDDPLPRGARPDLAVEGIITLDRLDDTIFVGRPVNAGADSARNVFKVVNGGKNAVRVPVQFGKSSVSKIQIREGLQPGDQIILSDMSQWENRDRIQLN